MRIISLTTDFGLNDWFVGAMKGVILAINPKVQVVDLAHGVPAGDIRSGAFALEAGHGVFPKGTIHVAVVDPGVGGVRGALVIETQRYVFVGPDNGVLSLAAAQDGVQSVRRVENRRYFRDAISNTFHGRDIFAPVAAHISRGQALARLGPATDQFVRLTLPKARVAGTGLQGEVIYVDRFGNLVTNIRGELLAGRPDESFSVSVGKVRLRGLSRFYGQARPNAPVALVNSCGYLEIALNRGDASRQLRLKVGSPVILRRTEP